MPQVGVHERVEVAVEDLPDRGRLHVDAVALVADERVRLEDIAADLRPEGDLALGVVVLDHVAQAILLLDCVQPGLELLERLVLVLELALVDAALGTGPRRIEGPIPVECRSASCGTCWVGVLVGAEKLTDVAAREGKKIKEFGYVETSEAKPLIRLACQAQALGAVSIVIPPWNGVFGKYLKQKKADF